MPSYLTALVVDVLMLLACGLVAIRYGKLRHSHPTIIYLFFHFYTITWRLIGLLNGAPTLFSNWGEYFDAVEPWEIERAAFLADVALVALTAGTVLAARQVSSLVAPHDAERRLSPRLIWTVGMLALIPGLWAMALYRPGTTPTAGGGFDPLVAAHESSYVQILPAWPTLILLILIYLYGFRPWLVVPMVACLLFMALQGYHRFRVIIPTIMLMQIHLDRRRLRWPRPLTVVALLLLAVAFFPMKRLGRLAQDGATTTDMIAATAQVTGDAVAGRADDQAFLDEYASGLTLLDARDKLYWGRPYAALVTLPIPRQFWAEKPSPADHIREISTDRRPMFEAGMIITILGEAYANFGITGMLVVPFLVGYLLSRFHLAAYRSATDSVLRFSYVMVGANLIQVYRDGLVSLVVFTAVNMMPLTILMILHRGLVPPTPPETSAGKSSPMPVAA